MDQTNIAIYAVIWLLCGIACYLIAQGRRTAPVPWFVAGIVLGPLGVLLALLTAKEGRAL